jgi:Domain of unknown function (DUF3854)/Protein of unknown function (DUF3631)
MGPGVTAGATLPLHPEALEDLRKSGLSDATIAEAGLYSPAPGDFARLLGGRLADRVRHVLVFPYDVIGYGGAWRGDDEFVRCKLFPTIADADGRTIRYHQRSGTPPRLYVPLRARPALIDARVTLLITEGEKKALKANQEGLACVAIGGLWNWQAGGRPIADFDRIDWCERETVIAPDSDVWIRPELLQPVFALGKELEGRGAKVVVLKLPSGPEGAKVGLDDYLCAHPAATCAALPRLALKHPFWSRTALWWRGWVKRKEDGGDSVAPLSALELLARAPSTRLLHPAQDVVDGVLWYGLQVEDALVAVTSARQVHRADQLPEGIAFRHAEPGPSTVSREVAVRWLTTEESGSIARTLEGLTDFLTRHVVLRDRPTALWIAAWVLATWCYRAFPVFPYLSIRSAEKRCGKSRLLGLLSRVCFNASPVTTHPTEAQLYRVAARTGGAQLFDEIETLRGDRERFDALISVLNAGFEQGRVVSRQERRGERFVEVPYEVYAPRVLAGIAGLKEALEDRALPLFMLRKRRSEEVARLNRATDAEAQALRDACALACLTRIGDIVQACELAHVALEREGIDDRAVDLWVPLLAIAFAADVEDGADRGRQILDAARAAGAQREADAEGGTTSRLLDALETIRASLGDTAAPAELLAALRARPGWDWLKSTKRLAGLLNPLGIARRQVWNKGERRWCYVLDPGQLADLRARYGALGADSDAGLPPAAASPSSAPETGANR